MKSFGNIKSYIVPFLAFLVIAGAVFGFFSSLMRNIEGDSFLGSKKSVNFVTAISELNFPSRYNEPLSLLNNTFSIQPLKAEAAQAMSEKNKKTVRYVNAYANTDVVQTKYSNKIKEDIILKQPGHPAEFAYQVNMSNYDFKKDQGGNFVFYQKGKSNDELSRVFTIPAPFMIDTKGKKSSTADVDSELTTDGRLTIRPNQNWLETSVYPITLDPTIEINIINVHSHPDQGDNWTVNFITQGRADLKIIPVDQATIDDDEFVSLSCGSNKVTPQILTGDVIYYPNWTCSETATVIHYTKVAGKHTLRFEFGDQIAYAYNTSSEIIFRASSPCNPAPITGGTITYTDSSGANPRSSPPYSGGYTVHTFTSSGSMVVTNSGNVSVLVVAGGGGGASGSHVGGGGGAGGVIYNASFAVTAQTYAVTVGNGGGAETNGGNSVFSSITATGGGRGGDATVAAGNGGSGGGAGYNGTGVGGTGTAGQGNDGGTNYAGLYGGAGGGGGAGAAGGNGVYQQSGAGGVGAAYSISGNSTYYGGGGGGAGNSLYGVAAGSGGTGGGGAGSSTSGTSGTANTGGGGGGSGSSLYVGGSGGSGIVIVRYLTSDFTCATQNANIVFRAKGAPTGGTITYTDSNGANPRTSPAYAGGYTVHTFTTSGVFRVLGYSGNVSALVVAGGGGGGSNASGGGGGGAGGVVYNSSLAVTPQSYVVTVGNGGAADTNGGNSIFSSITATGGGAGGVSFAGNGGSGGGAGYRGLYGTGTAGQGNNGGTGDSDSGGGGGAGAVGGNGATDAGSGGAGSAYSISGVSTYYGGGGGGGAAKANGGSGGTGGGGAGASYGSGWGSAGTANTGGGGGGGSYSEFLGYTGGAGGSGVVIIRYLTSDFPADSDPVILK